MWLRIDDGFFDHPKIIQLSRDGLLLHLSAMAYCAQHLTDGTVPRAAVPSIAARVKADRNATRELLEAGIWERQDNSTFELHDFLDYNPSKETVLARRATAAERKARSRMSRSESRRDLAGTHAGSHNGPSRPVPSLPLSPNGSKEGDRASAQHAKMAASLARKHGLSLPSPEAQLTKQEANEIIDSLKGKPAPTEPRHDPAFHEPLSPEDQAHFQKVLNERNKH